jgi:hypothetical protein
VAGDGGGLADRQVVLPVGGAEAPLAEQPLAPQLQHPGGQGQVAAVAGDPGQLDQGHLDAGVAVHPLPAGGPELLVDPVGGPDGDLEQPVVAQSPVPGHGRLDQMAGAVELVAPGEVGVRPPPGHDLDVAVEVAVGTLGGGHQPDRLVGGRLKGRVRGPPELPARRLQPLVDVGVQEREGRPRGVGGGPVAAAVPGLGPGGQPEVVEGPGPPQLVEAVGEGVLAVDPLALGQEAAGEPGPRGTERAQPPPRRLGRQAGAGAHFTAPVISPDT